MKYCTLSLSFVVSLLFGCAEKQAQQRVESTEVEEVKTYSHPVSYGQATYYADRFHGRKTASGELYDTTKLSAAHMTLPFGSEVKVTNQANGTSVIVKINDRGRFHEPRIIDLSRRAAAAIGLLEMGKAKVSLEVLSDTIRPALPVDQE